MMTGIYTARFSLGVPEQSLSSKSSLSIDMNPTVRPLIIPANKVQTIKVKLEMRLQVAKPA
jgi:hypothetical protein